LDKHRLSDIETNLASNLNGRTDARVHAHRLSRQSTWPAVG
jgi:hypothetical protein